MVRRRSTIAWFSQVFKTKNTDITLDKNQDKDFLGLKHSENLPRALRLFKRSSLLKDNQDRSSDHHHHHHLDITHHDDSLVHLASTKHNNYLLSTPKTLDQNLVHSIDPQDDDQQIAQRSFDSHSVFDRPSSLTKQHHDVHSQSTHTEHQSHESKCISTRVDQGLNLTPKPNENASVRALYHAVLDPDEILRGETEHDSPNNNTNFQGDFQQDPPRDLQTHQRKYPTESKTNSLRDSHDEYQDEYQNEYQNEYQRNSHCDAQREYYDEYQRNLPPHHQTQHFSSSHASSEISPSIGHSSFVASDAFDNYTINARSKESFTELLHGDTDLLQPAPRAASDHGSWTPPNEATSIPEATGSYTVQDSATESSFTRTDDTSIISSTEFAAPSTIATSLTGTGTGIGVGSTTRPPLAIPPSELFLHRRPHSSRSSLSEMSVISFSHVRFPTFSRGHFMTSHGPVWDNASIVTLASANSTALPVASTAPSTTAQASVYSSSINTNNNTSSSIQGTPGGRNISSSRRDYSQYPTSIHEEPIDNTSSLSHHIDRRTSNYSRSIHTMYSYGVDSLDD